MSIFRNINMLARVLVISFLLIGLIWMCGFRNSSTEIKNVKIHGMGIENLYVKDKISILTTTGGIFRVNLENGTIEIRQRIKRSRLLAKVILDKDWFKTLSDPMQEGFDCIWGGDSLEGPKVIISGDSVVRFFNIEKLDVKLQFSPIHHKVNDSNGGLLALDNEGGLVIAPPELSSNERYPKTFENNIWKFSAHDPLPFLFIGVCPPRHFDWKSSFLHNVHYSSHIQRYPTDEQIIEYSRYAKVLELHSWVWQNRYNPNVIDENSQRIPLWRDYSSIPQNYKWIPDDETEFKRTIKTAHDYGMKIITYVNFLHDFGKGSKGEVFQKQMEEIQRLKKEYGIDGLYLDGLYTWDPELNYKAVRTLRNIFGSEGWFTFHNTRPKGYFFPFINAYMNLIITSEHEAFDRWKSTSYNISNAIASIWPEIPIDVEDGRKLLKKMVDKSLLHNNRIVLMDGAKGQWRMWRLYFNDNEMKFMQEYYFKQLDEIRKVGYKKFIEEKLKRETFRGGL